MPDVLTPRFSLVRYREAPELPIRTAIRVDDRVRAVTDGELPVPSDIRSILDAWDQTLPVLRELATAESGWRPIDGLILESPVDPRQVLQTGANYRTHVIDLEVAHRQPDDPRSEEQARADAAVIMDERAAHGIPYFFIGLPTTVVGQDAPLALPAYSTKHDWELELAAVIGRRADRVSPEEALDYVAGYTVVNDVTTRDLVFRRDMPAIGTDWFRGKNAPGFNPAGPDLVPAEFVGDPNDLGIRLTVSGEIMQDATTADMLFSVQKLISAASETIPLLPGDLVFTGSPAGNGAHFGRFLRDGDVMVGEIENVGTQTISVVAGA
jgi:2-keto-4-pentenoate hydratase/2-oxohepta-3-ene-1,7-dioic acid hydratase in catechol pathway